MILYKSKNRENFIIVLKAIACLLITNSHCKDIYPIPYFALGGSFGNAAFFLVSGYCLADINLSFGKWYQRRMKRIIPSVAVIILLDVIFVQGIGTVVSKSFVEICIFYINQYWFVFAILLWYIIFYIVFYKESVLKVKEWMMIYFAGYMIFYIFGVDKTRFSIELGGFCFFKAYFYLGIMLTGGILRFNYDDIKEKVRNRKRTLCCTMALMFLLWAVTWGSINIMHIAFSIQFLVHIWVAGFVIALFCLTESCMEQRQSISKLTDLISESVLEIYLVQMTFKKYVMSFEFPINFVLFILLAFGGGIFFCRLKKSLFLRDS